MCELSDSLPNGSPNWRRVIRAAEIAFGVDCGDILSRRRSHDVVMARNAVFFLLVRKRKFSMSQIGRWMGKDHSTVHHALWRIETRYGKDPRVVRLIQETWDMACSNDPLIFIQDPEPVPVIPPKVIEREKAEARKVAKAEFAAVKKVIAKIKSQDDPWTRGKLEAMDRAFQLAISLEGDGMTYDGEEMRVAA